VGGDTHYGQIYVRNDVLFEKQKELTIKSLGENGQLVLEYDHIPWKVYNWVNDITSRGTYGTNLASFVDDVGNNYIVAGIWLPGGIYDIYTRSYTRGNTLSFKIDNHTLIVKERDKGDPGDWETIKIGTFYISEGVHSFELLYIDGRLNDIQDYLLIVKSLGLPVNEKKYVISIPVGALPTDYELPPDLWFDSTNALTETTKKYDVKLIIYEPAFFGELDGEIQAFLSYVKTHFSLEPEYSDEFDNKQVYVRSDLLLQEKGQLLLEYDTGWGLHNWGIDVTSRGTYGVSIWCPLGEIGDNYIKNGLWLPDGTYDIYTRAYARGNTLHFKVHDADIIIEEPLVGEFGEWAFIKLGTVYLEEGIHVFSISFIGGTMNDIQDYLLIVKVG